MDDTTAVPDAAPAWVNTDGSFGESSTIPEGIRGTVESKGFKNVEDVFKSYSNLESMKGDWSNPASMKLPESFNDDQMAQIRTKMGTPESADKYVFDGGIDMADPGIVQFKELSFAAGKTQATFEKDMEFYQGLVELGNTQEADTKAAFKESLGDGYDDYISRTSAVAEKLGIEQSTDPAVLAVLDKVSAMTVEGTIPPPQQQSQTLSKEEKIANIQKNPAFMQKQHPQHKAIMKEYNSLFGIG
jgi:hypothetical protein